MRSLSTIQKPFKNSLTLVALKEILKHIDASLGKSIIASILENTHMETQQILEQLHEFPTFLRNLTEVENYISNKEEKPHEIETLINQYVSFIKELISMDKNIDVLNKLIAM